MTEYGGSGPRGRAAAYGRDDVHWPAASSGSRTDHVVSCSEHEFLTMVSHELRHAAGVVSGFLDLVVDRGEVLSEDQTRQFLARARDNAHRMNRLLEDAGVALKLGSGRFSYSLRPVDLHAVVCATSQQVAQVEGRDIEVEQPASAPWVVADRDRQVQILTNLLSNAVKYSPDGSPVRVVLDPRDDEVAVGIHNAGQGAQGEELAQLFEPFVRLEGGPRAREGLGLGLYITRLLVEGQGGRIWADSSDDHGWTFTYTVPRAEPATVGSGLRGAPGRA